MAQTCLIRGISKTELANRENRIQSTAYQSLSFFRVVFFFITIKTNTKKIEFTHYKTRVLSQTTNALQYINSCQFILSSPFKYYHPGLPLLFSSNHHLPQSTQTHRTSFLSSEGVLIDYHLFYSCKARMRLRLWRLK